TERPATANYNLDTWTEHLIGFLDALGLDRVSAVGNSFGGALALSLATRYPSRVGKLVFMGSVGVPFQITPGLDAVWGFEPSVPAMRALLDLFAYDNSLVSDDLARIRLAAATRPGVHEAYQAMFPAPRQASVDAMTLPDEAIAAIRCPTLVIHGREDQVIPLANSKRLHQLIPGSQLQIFDHCGHWVQIEHTAEFNKLIEEFLA
ncbi:MAG TPA: alpha/beta fold hydrolase, partial [Marmoricola sp.]|nr:alpha/beta fold hydrolase [Marmoricola sp.]